MTRTVLWAVNRPKHIIPYNEMLITAAALCSTIYLKYELSHGNFQPDLIQWYKTFAINVTQLNNPKYTTK
jgi:hypothetical protein